mmetsp:Transcript_14056/g.30061  ORF Transcript_14056/g.30061 Transcript_14056/m.30061 type:complete len:471 (-) Transcript_14056:73-1485(-)
MAQPMLEHRLEQMSQPPPLVPQDDPRSEERAALLNQLNEILDGGSDEQVVGISQLTDHVFLGSAEDCADHTVLFDRYGITHVINLVEGEQKSKPLFDSRVQYLGFDCRPKPYDIRRVVPDVLEFFESGLKLAGERMLIAVHCKQGGNRGGLVASILVARELHVNLIEAASLVLEKRPMVLRSSTFRKQLVQLALGETLNRDGTPTQATAECARDISTFSSNSTQASTTADSKTSQPQSKPGRSRVMTDCARELVAGKHKFPESAAAHSISTMSDQDIAASIFQDANLGEKGVALLERLNTVLDAPTSKQPAQGLSGITRLTDHVFLGSAENFANNEEIYDELGITHIVSVSEGEVKSRPRSGSKVQLLGFNCSPKPFDMRQIVPTVLDFYTEATTSAETKTKLAVHCRSGGNRGGFLAVILVAHELQLDIIEAAARVYEKRPMVLRSPLFRKWLVQWAIGDDSTTRACKT